MTTTPEELIVSAEKAIDEANALFNSYPGPVHQYTEVMDRVNSMYQYAQACIALANYKKVHGGS